MKSIALHYPLNLAGIKNVSTVSEPSDTKYGKIW